MSAVPTPYLSPAEYLEIERRSEIKHEYYAGEMFAMAGGTERHILISCNVAGELRNQFKGRSCRAYGSDMRVRVEATGLYTYPDVVAVCGEPRFDREMNATLLNPLIIVEVLSESTEADDRGQKFEHYRKIPSLREYVLVAQDRPHLERFLRKEDGPWELSEYDGLDAIVELPSIGCKLALAEVYDKLEFPK